MKYLNLSLVLLLLLAGLIIVPACAAEITLTAESSEYYIPLGEAADIPVLVMSGYDHTVDGTLQFSTVEQLQNTGTVMTSTKNRVYTHTIDPGASQITISAGTSSVEKSMQVQVTYDYTDTSAVRVTLPVITIHFVSQVPQPSTNRSPVTSTSGAGTGNVPSSSSVQIVQQSVSVQQQAGRDGTVQQALSNSQQSQDTSALKEQLQREAEQAELEKTAFEEALSRDALLGSVNESLAADGFARQSLSSDPTSGNAGTFSMEYQNAAGESVTVAGAMENGAVPSVAETSKAPVNVTAPLASNTTYQNMAEQLKAQGYTRNTTAVNISATGSMVNLSFQNPGGKQAFINATTDDTNVTSISLATEPDAPFDYLPLIAGLIAAAVIIGAVWILYRRFRCPVVMVREPAGPSLWEEPFDHRAAARELLARAETAYTKQQHAEACGLAGQALRLFLSRENGAHHEMTNTELMAFLQSREGDSRKTGEILGRCSDVEFAKGTLGADEFPAMVAYIRSVIDTRS
ncbi:hypothetical protein [Methanoregula sp.]|uniref:hypothetical protein n=1 Tax=Methanoregula sp. TaxID=2052170 RepID=UPI00236A319C|nr:hypothetical protein [Methanoregula sp.]MDD1687584.1 hypothetical protein [Methanoregula sp.]